jgi:hypothetical protein
MTERWAGSKWQVLPVFRSFWAHKGYLSPGPAESAEQNGGLPRRAKQQQVLARRSPVLQSWEANPAWLNRTEVGVWAEECAVSGIKYQVSRFSFRTQYHLQATKPTTAAGNKAPLATNSTAALM